jgi:hypothetical protein
MKKIEIFTAFTTLTNGQQAPTEEGKKQIRLIPL